ncbi:helix-turn-helix domain-containing protein [Geomonas sp. Red69]|uniref:helix-turn-helix domain-containing protein n=1 Tax=Geomonas diazotrophica TaxID=2843197 RepID=UPI001C11CD0B|nr:helix-turn-helix transcriptional regulator [Geomonas diazotrophica]MBU5638846.1 helix-turn-helix domain-containing protein [Geomonas diazotrophica]
MAELEEQIGERIRRSREALGLTQRQLADLVGSSPPNINYYEKGSRSAPLSMVIKLASVLGISTDFLLLGTGPQMFIDDQLSELFKDFSTLKPRDRKIVTQVIKFMKEQAKE